MFGGAGNAVFTGANAYTGTTTINAGRVILTNTASLGSTNIIVSSGATFDVAGLASIFTLGANQSLAGSGTNNGSVTTVSGANDKLVVLGNLNLTNTVFHIKAPNVGSNLDPLNDYLLAVVSGTLAGSVTATPVWDVQAGNYGAFAVIITNGNQIVLHAVGTPPSFVGGSANPSVVGRNQTIAISAAVTQGLYSISNVTANAGNLGSPASVTLVDDGAGNYTNSIAATSATTFGAKSIPVTVTDSGNISSVTNLSVTVVATNRVWSGGAPSDNNWSSNPNWNTSAAPGFIGDSVAFDGGARLSPLMETNYSVSGPTPANLSVARGFAGSFNLIPGGQNPRLQWRHNGVNLPNATNETYAILSAVIEDAGNYDVGITNSFGSSITSSVATATILPAPGTANITVNVASNLATVTGTAYGIHASLYANQLGNAGLTNQLIQGGVKIIRYPGGGLADVFHWSVSRPGLGSGNGYGLSPWFGVSNNYSYMGPKTDFGSFAQLLTTGQFQALITINYGSGLKYGSASHTNLVVPTTSGAFSYRPLVTQSNSTNLFTLKVADDGTPSLSATQSFNVFVNPLASPTLVGVVGGGGVALTVNGTAGPDYAVQASTNLTQWGTLYTTNSPAPPFSWMDTNTSSFPARFYRVQLGYDEQQNEIPETVAADALVDDQRKREASRRGRSVHRQRREALHQLSARRDQHRHHRARQFQPGAQFSRREPVSRSAVQRKTGRAVHLQLRPDRHGNRAADEQPPPCRERRWCFRGLRTIWAAACWCRQIISPAASVSIRMTGQRLPVRRRPTSWFCRWTPRCLRNFTGSFIRELFRWK